MPQTYPILIGSSQLDVEHGDSPNHGIHSLKTSHYISFDLDSCSFVVYTVPRFDGDVMRGDIKAQSIEEFVMLRHSNRDMLDGALKTIFAFTNSHANLVNEWASSRGLATLSANQVSLISASSTKKSSVRDEDVMGWDLDDLARDWGFDNWDSYGDSQD